MDWHLLCFKLTGQSPVGCHRYPQLCISYMQFHSHSHAVSVDPEKGPDKVLWIMQPPFSGRKVSLVSPAAAVHVPQPLVWNCRKLSGSGHSLSYPKHALRGLSGRSHFQRLFIQGPGKRECKNGSPQV